MGCRRLPLMSGGVGCSYIYNKVAGGCGSRWGGSHDIGALLMMSGRVSLMMSGALGVGLSVVAVLMTLGRF